MSQIAMLANSSDKADDELKAFKSALVSADVSWRGRLLLLTLNFIPLSHAGSTVLLLLWPGAPLSERIGIALAFLYLVPPLIGRLIMSLTAFPAGRIAVGSKRFFAWWTLFQLQIVFGRLPAIEEVLRLVPGLYSQWLRLWGARIGRLTYWSPGTLITDRSFLYIGDDVIFGAGVRLNPHVLVKNSGGRTELLLARVKIGDRVMVGGYSLLTAGTEITSGEATRAFLVSPPFSVWRNGKRVRTQYSTDHE
jgi:hypothetical protein